jgi:hypothetical protein
MSWVSLGTVNPDDQWRSFPADVVDSETFRVVQGTTDPWNAAYIAQYFPSPGGIVFPSKKIYPGVEPIIFTLPIPRDLRLQNALTRTMMIRRKLPYYPTPWNIELQVLY